MSASDHWCSPPEVADPLEEFFDGPVWCDPCSNPTSIIRARNAYTIAGLHLPWGRGRQGKDTAFTNNPYSSTAPWITKGHHELDIGNLRELVYLVMSVPSTAWWRQAAAHKSNPRIIITKRLCFIDPAAKHKKQRRTNARFDTALIYYGPRSRVRAFDKAFAAITSWSTWGRSGAV